MVLPLPVWPTSATDWPGSATKEMSVQATDVAKTAQALSEMARSQQVLLSQFRLSREAASVL